MFSKIVGNEKAKKSLNQLLQNDRVPHLLLFSGVEGVGKRLFAESFARAWLQGEKEPKAFEPDLHILKPEGKTGMHSMQAIKDLNEKLSYLPYESKGIACIIDDAERMLASSANALLKTLEEPKGKTLIILVSSQPEKLLLTIRSRC